MGRGKNAPYLKLLANYFFFPCPAYLYFKEPAGWATGKGNNPGYLSKVNPGFYQQKVLSSSCAISTCQRKKSFVSQSNQAVCA